MALHKLFPSDRPQRRKTNRDQPRGRGTVNRNKPQVNAYDQHLCMKDHTSEQLPQGLVNDVIIKCSA